jgi:hypothetical protein
VVLLALADPVVGVVLVTTAFAGFVLAAVTGSGKRDPAKNNARYDESENYEPSEPFHCASDPRFSMAAERASWPDYQGLRRPCHHSNQ